MADALFTAVLIKQTPPPKQTSRYFKHTDIIPLLYVYDFGIQRMPY